MATRKRSGKTPCKQEGCTTGCQATYRDLASERYASKTLCTKCGQAAKERGELVVGQTMWRNAMKRCESAAAAKDDLVHRMHPGGGAAMDTSAVMSPPASPGKADDSPADRWRQHS